MKKQFLGARRQLITDTIPPALPVRIAKEAARIRIKNSLTKMTFNEKPYRYASSPVAAPYCSCVVQAGNIGIAE